MMRAYSFDTNVFGNFDHDKNYTELCIENYFPEKNHLTKIFSKNLAFLKGLELVVNKCEAR